MSNIDVLSSKLLSNKDIIIDLYSVIKTAATLSYNDPEVIANKRNVCLLPLEKEGVKRVFSSEQCIQSTDAEVEYFPDALTIIGGSAISLYDYALRNFIKKRGVVELRQIVKKETSDLDMVWWPSFTPLKPEIEQYTAISSSVAITTLVSAFKRNIENVFNSSPVGLLMDKIGSILGGKTEASVNIKHTKPAGVWNVEVTFNTNGTLYKLIEIAVHDCASGQRYDRDGNEINKLIPMNYDPVYSTVKPGDSKVYQLKFGNTLVSVPNVLSLTDQQLFAFSMLLKLNAPKSLINYKRIVYIIELLSGISFTNERNLELANSLFGIKTDKQRRELVDNITKLAIRIIRNNFNTILSLSEPLLKSDNAVNELYRLALQQRKKQLTKERDTKIEALDRLLEQVGNKQNNIDNISAQKQDIIQKYDADLTALTDKINKATHNALYISQNADRIESEDVSDFVSARSSSPMNTPETSPLASRSITPVPNKGLSQPPLPQQPPLPPLPPKQYTQNIRRSNSRTTRKNRQPPLPQRYPSQQSTSILDNPLTPPNRLLHNPTTNTYSIADVLHNTFVYVKEDPQTGQLFSMDSYTKQWIPVFFDEKTGIFYPVYYYKDLGHYAVYNDVKQTRVPVEYNTELKKYIVLTQVKPSPTIDKRTFGGKERSVTQKNKKDRK